MKREQKWWGRYVGIFLGVIVVAGWLLTKPARVSAVSCQSECDPGCCSGDCWWCDEVPPDPPAKQAQAAVLGGVIGVNPSPSPAKEANSSANF
jgi:hypothetical protein